MAAKDLESERCDAALALTRELSGRGLESGLFLAVVAATLALTPFTMSSIVDPKLVLVLAGALLARRAAARAERRLAVAAGAWVAAAALAAVFGVDRWQALMGSEDQGNGLLLIAASAMLFLVGAGMPEGMAARLPAWLVGTGVAVAGVGILGALGAAVPLVGAAGPDARGSLIGSTLGHQVFLGAFLAAAIAATVRLARSRPTLALAALAVLASSLSLTAKRGAWLAAAIGLAVALPQSGLPRRRMAALVATVLMTLGAWTAVDLAVRLEEPVAATRRFAEIGQGSALARRYIWTSSARGFLRRPLLGWGPASTWGANVSSATQAEMRMTGRIWHDAHNLFVESLVGTGVVGTAALAVLIGLGVARARRAPSSRRWAAAGAAALGVHHLLQPIHVSLTPLAFLLLGVAAGGGGPPLAARVGRRWRGATSLLLAAGLALAFLRMGASTFEAYGRRYGSEPALRLALRLEPLRVSAAERLAIERAVDSRGRDLVAAREARAIARRLVRLHPWDVDVRLFAADVALLQDDPAGAAGWYGEQLRRFPKDARAMGGLAFAALRMGDRETAVRWARRSVALDPEGPAKRLLQRASPRARPG
ncbi:MAG: O-antigen ligase family protein [Acidobacteria bacterium]|nr:O-antigen ligase family protein [Acidobacteriota bacterium]